MRKLSLYVHCKFEFPKTKGKLYLRKCISPSQKYSENRCIVVGGEGYFIKLLKF